MEINQKYLDKLIKQGKNTPTNPLSKNKEERDIDKFDDRATKSRMNLFSMFSILLSMSLVYTIHITYFNLIWTIVTSINIYILAYFNEREKKEAIINYFKAKLSKINPDPNFNPLKMYMTSGLSIILALLGVYMFLFQKEKNSADTKDIAYIQEIVKIDSLNNIKIDSLNNLLQSCEDYVNEKNKTLSSDIDNLKESIEILQENFKSVPAYKRDLVEHNKVIDEKNNKISSLNDKKMLKIEEREIDLIEQIQKAKEESDKEKKSFLSKNTKNNSVEDEKNNYLNYFLLFITFIVEAIIVYFGYVHASNFCKFENELNEYKKYLLNHPFIKELDNTKRFLDRLYLNHSVGSIVRNKFLEQMNQEYSLKPNTEEMTNLMKNLKIYTGNKSKKIMIDKNTAMDNLYSLFLPIIKQEIDE